MPIHNGQHRCDEPYFEWWYFHFISEEGYYFNLLLHPTDIFAQHRDPYMSVSMIDPDNRLHYFRKSLPPDVFDKSERLLNIDHERLKIAERGDRISLDVDLGGFRCRGSVEKNVEPYISNTGVLYRNESHGNYWFVAVPHGRFALECELDDAALSLTGSAYHDHNWGTAMLQQYFRGWIWSHLVWEGGFLLFYHVLASDGAVIKRGLLSDGGSRHILEDFELEVAGDEGNPEAMSLPREMTVRATAGELELKVRVAADRVFRKREDTDFRGFVPHYYRARCSASVTIGSQVETALGLVECLRIDSKTER